MIHSCILVVLYRRKKRDDMFQAVTDVCKRKYYIPSSPLLFSFLFTIIIAICRKSVIFNNILDMFFLATTFSFYPDYYLIQNICVMFLSCRKKDKKLAKICKRRGRKEQIYCITKDFKLYIYSLLQISVMYLYINIYILYIKIL